MPGVLLVRRMLKPLMMKNDVMRAARAAAIGRRWTAEGDVVPGGGVFGFTYHESAAHRPCSGVSEYDFY